MKLSSSSASASIVSFDPKICTSRSATAGFLRGILRRILCFSSLPTHPADYTAEANSVTCYKYQQFDGGDKIDESKFVCPGIVARLMGLNSLPAEIDPITRSKSMNSADYKQDGPDLIHGKHRRVNSTLSICDMPEYFELENEEYFVLTFEKKSERKETRSKSRKRKGDNGEPKQRKYGAKENRAMEEKNTGEQEKANRRDLSVFNEENMSSSEDSSPVSVLDFDQFILEHDDVRTSEEDSKAEGFNSSKRKLSAELENYVCKSPTNDSNLMEDDPKTVEAKNLGSSSEMNSEVWDAICSITEVEVAKSTWLCTQNEELEDISADFGSNILDQLLDELIVQHF